MAAIIFLMTIIAILSFVLMFLYMAYIDEIKNSIELRRQVMEGLTELNRISDHFGNHIKIRNKYLNELTERPYDMEKFMEYNAFIARYSPYETEPFNEEHRKYLATYDEYERLNK